jgi:hypothetical protein
MTPRLDSGEVELVRAQLLSEARTRRDSPDALVAALADSARWAGHPYALEPVGTEETISRITLADLRRYQREQMVTSRMLLVIVGNVDRPAVERLVRSTIGRLPRGTYQWKAPPPVAPGRSSLTVASRPLPTNYLLGYYGGPPASSPDYPALRVATAVLSGRLFSEIRSRRNLTYAVDAPFVERAISVGGLYVTTTQPDLTLGLMQSEVARLQQEILDHYQTRIGRGLLYDQMWHDYALADLPPLFHPEQGSVAEMFAVNRAHFLTQRIYAPALDELRGKLRVAQAARTTWEQRSATEIAASIDLAAVPDTMHAYLAGMGLRVGRASQPIDTRDAALGDS